MGTRSLTYFYEEDADKPFMCMYRQFDGYPEGHGAELGQFLAKFEVVNGFGTDQEAGSHANGMGCLAAQMVAEFKTTIGNHYLVAPELQQDSWQEYEYHVHPKMVEVRQCYGDGEVIFSGSYEALAKWAIEPTRTEDGDYVVTKATPKAAPKDLDEGLLHNVITVSFTKADGTKRVMRCTKDANVIPEDALNRIVNGHKAKAPAGVYRVWDIEKADWRSFKKERVLDWHVCEGWNQYLNTLKKV